MPRKCLQPKLPLGPLMHLSGLDEAFVSVPCRQGGTVQKFAGQMFLSELIGWSRTTVRSWLSRGIPLSVAEDACDRLGLHPCEVWGDLWIEAVFSVEAA